ncbi:uncharacterized protein [Ptychodera flava]|uniref:uncharacterized protein n=1 Tax=Ptychodera flava TaxID=63121 RepID=UPI00396A74EE
MADSKLSIPLKQNETKDLHLAVQTGLPQLIASKVLKIRSLNFAIKKNLLIQLNSDCERLSKKDASESSILRRKTPSDMKEFKWHGILREMKDEVPYLLDILVGVAVPVHREATNSSRCGDARMYPISTVYGILMQQRHRELSLLQRINTVILSAGKADSKHTHLSIYCIVRNKSSIGDTVPASSMLCKSDCTTFVIEAALDFFNMANVTSKPTRYIPPSPSSTQPVKKDYTFVIIFYLLKSLANG